MPVPDWLLVVDDDPDGRDLLAELLEMSGFAAVACANAGEAEAIFDQRGRPKLVLTDFMMPDMPGTTFVTRMRSRPGFGDVPVVYVTGFDQSSLPGLRDPVLRKPFDVDKLLSVVSDSCARA
jgi:CheY-like chemotaxis protein